MFEGYCDKTVDLFWGIRLNNDRDWFQTQKADFAAYVMKPTKELAGELYDWLSETYPGMNLNLHISRVYRDARRLFGRGPLNDHIWFSFQSADENRAEAPCLWFEVGADGYGYGAGWWMRAADAMRYRKLIDADEKAFRKIVRPLEKQTELKLDAPEYAKPKGHADDDLRAWYNLRTLNVCCMKKYDALSYSRQLVDAMKDGYLQLMPYFQFMEKVYKSRS